MFLQKKKQAKFVECIYYETKQKVKVFIVNFRQNICRLPLDQQWPLL